MKNKKILIVLTLTFLIVSGLLYLRKQIFETPLICLDFMNPVENWKDFPEDRYCIMRRIVTSQELKGLTEKEVTKLLGESGEEIGENGTGTARYLTNHGLGIGWYFLAIDYENGKVVKMREELD